MATPNIKIFFEGKDTEFIKEYAGYLKIPISDENLINVGGFEKLFTPDNITILQSNSFEGGINLVVFDADFPQNEGGFEKRKSYLEEKKKEYKLDFELFLFPNHQDDGDIEELLESIAINKPIFDCINDYENCIQAKGYSLKFREARKTRIHGYMSAIPKAKKVREQFKEDFKKGIYYLDNIEYWDINSLRLAKLKDFLLQHIKEV